MKSEIYGSIEDLQDAKNTYQWLKYEMLRDIKVKELEKLYNAIVCIFYKFSKFSKSLQMCRFTSIKYTFVVLKKS